MFCWRRDTKCHLFCVQSRETVAAVQVALEFTEIQFCGHLNANTKASNGEDVEDKSARRAGFLCTKHKHRRN